MSYSELKIPGPCKRAISRGNASLRKIHGRKNALQKKIDSARMRMAQLANKVKELEQTEKFAVARTDATCQRYGKRVSSLKSRGFPTTIRVRSGGGGGGSVRGRKKKSGSGR